jgi:hypothetical protein
MFNHLQSTVQHGSSKGFSQWIRVAVLVAALLILALVDHQLSSLVQDLEGKGTPSALPETPVLDAFISEGTKAFGLLVLVGALVSADWEKLGAAKWKRVVRTVKAVETKKEPCARWNLGSCKAQHQRCKFGHFCNKCGNASHRACECQAAFSS